MSDSTTAVIDIINEAIANSELSYEDLHEIGDHVRECRKELQRQKGARVAAQITNGSTVSIRRDANLSPKYILGTVAKVVKINQTTASILLGHVNSPGNDSRFYTGQVIRCPLNALEPMEVSNG
jgi:hypothetical protein